jgi:hypothetical protein
MTKPLTIDELAKRRIAEHTADFIVVGLQSLKNILVSIGLFLVSGFVCPFRSVTD